MVNLGEIYDGIELKLKAHGNNVEKLLYVKPGADPNQIKIRLSGMQPQESSFGKGEDRTDVTAGRGTDAPAGTSLQEVKPGADTEQMKICLSGMNDCGMRSAECGIEVPKSKLQNPKLQINNAGELEAETALGTVAFTRPIAYQEIDGKRVEVECAYTIEENLEFGFWIVSYSAFRIPQSTTSDSPNPKSAIQIPKSEYCFTVASYDKSKRPHHRPPAGIHVPGRV